MEMLRLNFQSFEEMKSSISATEHEFIEQNWFKEQFKERKKCSSCKKGKEYRTGSPFIGQTKIVQKSPH